MMCFQLVNKKRVAGAYFQYRLVVGMCSVYVRAVLSQKDSNFFVVEEDIHTVKDVKY